MTPEKTPRRLGRGLDALFNAAPALREDPASGLVQIPVEQIRNNPFQPRQNFNAEELKELTESLRSSGLLQPITVRRNPDGSRGYELVAGERRLRAATDLGWKSISAIVRDLDDRQLLSLALVENLQRSDLNPIEEAEGYDRLIREFGNTQQSVADMVGKNRSTISNMLRVLQLPDSVQQMVRDGVLSPGHARPLLGLQDEAQIVNLAHEITGKSLTARDVEQRVRELTASAPTRKGKRGRPSTVDLRPAEIRDLESQLRKHLQTDVSITVAAADKGSIKISFYSTEDLERVTDLMGLPQNPQ